MYLNTKTILYTVMLTYEHLKMKCDGKLFAGQPRRLAAHGSEMSHVQWCIACLLCGS